MEYYDMVNINTTAVLADAQEFAQEMGPVVGLFSIIVRFFSSRWESTLTWSIIFAISWLHRYVRFIVNSISHWRYKSKPLPENPTFTSKDVTVVIPTIHNRLEELRPSLQSILACQPHELILVTTAAKYHDLQKLADSLDYPRIKVLFTQFANKRLQVCAALPQVRTDITIMADDDVSWPKTLIPWVLAPFEDPKIGGVGTNQRVRREWDAPLAARCWNWLGAAYIERRNFEISATHNLDGGTSCMSGRTGAYRTEILKSAEFLDGFQRERWRKYILNADDDNFVTRWLVSHQWKTWIQYERECELETTLENGMKFLYQCSRWARSNWRSNFTSLVVERHVWRQQPWCTYALHFATFTSLAFVMDPFIIFALYKATAAWDPSTRWAVVYAQIFFVFAITKTVKLWGLFKRNPSDILYLPLSILFGYFHGLIKLYALLTLNMTSWGSRADGDVHDKHRLLRPQRSLSMSTPKDGRELVRYVTQRRMTVPSRSEKPVLHD